MKKYLLLFLMCIYASIGAWADAVTVSTDENGLTTVNCTDNGNSEVTVTGNFPAEGSISNIKVVGPFTTGVSDKIATALGNNFSSFTRLDLSEATGVTTSTLSTYSIVGWAKMGYIKHLILPTGASVPTAAQLQNNVSGSLDPWDAMEYFVIPQSDGTCDIYLTEVGLTSISDADIIIDNKSASTVTVHLAEGEDENPATEATKTTIENYLKTQGYKLFVAPYTVSGCNVSINMDGAAAGQTLADLITAAKADVTGSICTLMVTGEIDDTDLAALNGEDLSDATKIDLSGATIAAESSIDNITLQSSIKSLVLPKDMTVTSTLADVLDGYTNLDYAYSPSSDCTATGPNQADETNTSTYRYDATKNTIADYVWVNKAGGLKQAFENEEQLRNSFYIKVASSVALTETDVNFNGCTNKPTNYLFLDFSESNLTPSVAASYTVTDNIGYRIILPNGWTGNQMAVFAANPNCGNLAAVYSYDGTTLKIMEIVDASYSQAALANPRIMRSGTTEVDVVSGYYDGNTYAQFGTNLLAALNNMGKSSFSVTKNDVTTNYTNTLGQSVKTISIMTTSAAPNVLTFDNPSITTLKAENLVQNNAGLNVNACSALTSLSVKGSNLKSVTASGNTSITSADFSGTAIASTTNFNGATKLATFTTTSESIFNGNVDLTSSKLSAFTSEARFGGNINFNASSSLASIDLSGAKFSNNESVIHVDAETAEGEGNTIINSLQKADGIKVPSSFANNVATRVHPYDESFVNVASPVAEAYNITTTDMTFHDKEAGDNTDHYRYWYQGAADSKKILTLGTSDSRRLSGAIAAIPADQNYSTTQYAKIKVVGPLTSADITKLKDLNCTALDLSEATYGGSTEGETIGTLLKGSFSDTSTLGVHSNVKFIALPDSCTRDYILNEKALAGLKNSVYCVIAVNETSDGKDLTSYSFQSGSLQPAVVAFQNSVAYSWTKILSTETTPTTKYTSNVSNFKKLKISGLINSYDLSKASQKLDADGHLAWKEDVVESTDQTRTLIEDDANKKIYAYNVYGPFSACFLLTEIDLRDAYFEPKSGQTVDENSVYYRYWYSDMTLSFLNVISTATYKVVIPQNSKVREIPADFMRCSTGIRAICIPSNIQAIRTRAFYTIDYIWTTADAYATTTSTADPEGNNTKLDNGAKLSNGTAVSALLYEHGKYKENPEFQNSYYTADYSGDKGGGTYTFGSTLKLIETGAFANARPHVKDVYVLNTKAPECHVDAFNTVMYTGNGGYSSISGDQKIISRENYINNGFWITMLHYPRQTTTPELQRYTDPTREYSIATGERDGKGATLYLPNQSEFIRAYQQGTYGYVWNAWNPTRQYGSVNNGTLTNTTAGWEATGQTAANALFDAYTSGVNHEYTSFYKVDNFNGKTVTAPTATITPYYNVYWSDAAYKYSNSATEGYSKLYPRSEIDSGSDSDNSGEKTEKDYRGWHQFVLNAYAANTILNEEPYRSYITDNEWWTICPTFDITREEAIKLFGTPASWNPGGVEKIPYVSKLRYVRRTYSDQKITLNFSKNLMVYKETRANATDQHGTLDENGVMNVGSGEDTGTPNSGDVVMSAGVPYLIKPNMTAVNGGFNRQFRVYTDADYAKLSDEQKSATNPRAINSTSLYNKIKAAQEMSGDQQITIINSGKYTVPVFVSGRSDGETAGYEVEEVERDGENKPKTYTIASSPYEKSTTWKYTFVGTFYKSFLPHYCYYLGWDSSLGGAGGARFFYLDGEKGKPGVFTYYDNNMNWNNETGVICPTKGDFNYTVTPASGLLPATWIIGAEGSMRTSSTSANNNFLPIDSYVMTGGSGAKAYEMVFGAPDVIADDSDVTGIENVNDDSNINNIEGNDINVYTINGQKVGTSLEGLPKGIYIVNGKKFIVK